MTDTMPNRTAQDWRTWLPTTVLAESDGTDEFDPDAPDFTPATLLDDDPVGALAADVRRRAQRATQRRAVRTRLLGVGGAGVLVAVLAGAVTMWSQRTDSQAAAPVAPVVAASTTVAPVWCAPVESAARIVGNGRGKTPDQPGATGPQVILWQQFAWYTLRDADAARAVLAADAVAAPVESARAAVAAIPTGTKHCVTITPLAPDRWDVRIDESHPDGAQAHWQQTVTTALHEGSTVITSVVAGGER